MIKIEQLIAAVQIDHPERTEDEIVTDLLERGMVLHGYFIDEAIEPQSNEGKESPYSPCPPVSLGLIPLLNHDWRRLGVKLLPLAVAVNQSAMFDAVF